MVRQRRIDLPTHWTRALDPETGCPVAVRGEDYPAEEIGGKLPRHFGDGRFFDWVPRHDPKGIWVELEEKRRGALWEEAKTARQEEKQANVSVSIAGRSLVFQADLASIAELQLQLLVALADPEHFEPIEWTTAGNAQVSLDAAALTTVVKAIAAKRRELHELSQMRRELIFDDTTELPRNLDDLSARVRSKS